MLCTYKYPIENVHVHVIYSSLLVTNTKLSTLQMYSIIIGQRSTHRIYIHLYNVAATCRGERGKLGRGARRDMAIFSKSTEQKNSRKLCSIEYLNKNPGMFLFPCEFAG